VDKRINISTPPSWEPIVDYSRTVRIGNYVSASGTTSMDGRTGKIVLKGDAYAQTVNIIKNVEYALLKAQATLNDVIRTRIFVLNIDKDCGNGANNSKLIISIVTPHILSDRLENNRSLLNYLYYIP
jgi:enamine deaminase RidA (YjgF/YER057c/UK114 family)